MTPALRIMAVLALTVIAAGTWLAAAYSWLMCIFSVVLGPLVIGIFAFSAALTFLAGVLSAAAIEAVANLFTQKKAAS